jgi:cell division protein FtsB
MNPHVGFWTKLTNLVRLLLFLACVSGVVVWYLPLIRHNEALRKEILRLEDQIQQAEETGRRLDHAIRALRNDPRTVERIAREKLSLVKPGETMIRFEEPAANGFPRR